MDDTDAPQLSDATKASFQPIMKAIGAVRAQVTDVKDVIAIRPGYQYPPEGKPVPAIVVAIRPGTSPVQATELQTKFGVPFTVIDATVEEQLTVAQKAPVSFGTPGGSMVSALETLLKGEAVLDFLPPKTGSYKEPDKPNLPLVNETMEMTICVSPEAGWSELETFLGETESTLTVAMYQFTAPHIFKAIEDAVTPAKRKFELILHPVPEKPAKSGVKANDLNEQEDVIDPLDEKMKQRFEQTWATLISKKNPEGLFASAYHIKVAVRDSSAVWLSSGNWQSSNQPDVHPFVENPDELPAGFQSKYNRDYHAIIKNDKLASIYEFYIKRDFELSAASRSGRQLRAAGSLSPTRSFCPDRARRTCRFRQGTATVQAAAAEPRGKRSAVADSGQLCGKCTEADQVGQEERLVSKPVHQLPRHRRRFRRIPAAGRGAQGENRRQDSRSASSAET